MSMANVAGVLAGAGAGRTLKKATGTPYGDDERVRKMMATRPGLNANQRRAPKQDLSGATPQGTLVGRGGRTQQLGKAAMSRLPPPAAPPTATSTSAPQGGFTTAMAGGGPELQMADKVGRGMTPNPMQPTGDAGFNGGNSPEMERYFAERAQGGAGGAAPGMVSPLEQAYSRSAQAMGLGGQGGGQVPPGDFGGIEIGAQPSKAQPDTMNAYGISKNALFGGGGQVPPEMAGAVQTALAGAGGGGGFSPGLPPAIQQRLQALRGGGLQGGAGAGAGGAPNPRTFADFWQGGNAPVRAF